MADMFKNAFNKYAKFGNKINSGINKVVGKEILGEIREIEEPREFPAYGSFPEYTISEPEQWSSRSGDSKEFTLEGNIISVSSNLDACIQYRNFFRSSAQYYSERFKFKYQNCVKDFDTFIHYFSDIYKEGLMPMITRAYSLLLPFGVFSVNIDDFTSKHINTYRKAINSFETMAGIETAKNQFAEQFGNQIGGAVQMQGGGFGFKGAMKGMAKAEAFNLGMGLLGKLAAHQTKMSQEEKANVFAQFKHDIFFQEVYSDYANTFLTMVQTLSDSGELGDVTTLVSKEMDTTFKNLQNPMFPTDKIASILAKLISTNPFVSDFFDLLQQKFGQTEEVKKIVNYFV